jgi:hypothetical protein
VGIGFVGYMIQQQETGRYLVCIYINLSALLEETAPGLKEVNEKLASDPSNVGIWMERGKPNSAFCDLYRQNPC